MSKGGLGHISAVHSIVKNEVVSGLENSKLSIATFNFPISHITVE